VPQTFSASLRQLSTVPHWIRYRGGASADEDGTRCASGVYTFGAEQLAAKKSANPNEPRISTTTG
jgi:hypothetical protein